MSVCQQNESHCTFVCLSDIRLEVGAILQRDVSAALVVVVGRLHRSVCTNLPGYGWCTVHSLSSLLPRLDMLGKGQKSSVDFVRLESFSFYLLSYCSLSMSHHTLHRCTCTIIINWWNWHLATVSFDFSGDTTTSGRERRAVSNSPRCGYGHLDKKVIWLDLSKWILQCNGRQCVAKHVILIFWLINSLSHWHSSTQEYKDSRTSKIRINQHELEAAQIENAMADNSSPCMLFCRPASIQRTCLMWFLEVQLFPRTFL